MSEKTNLRMLSGLEQSQSFKNLLVIPLSLSCIQYNPTRLVLRLSKPNMRVFKLSKFRARILPFDFQAERVRAKFFFSSQKLQAKTQESTSIFLAIFVTTERAKLIFWSKSQIIQFCSKWPHSAG